ncbi:MAG TPA: peptide ABC transporter substrate-binding protein, partial [Bacteroidia bacterium]|nr:peptide ABC transporter substrate-binding protein [Bacteroidia bacterium]
MALALALVRMGRIAAGTIRIDGAPVSAMGPRRFHPFRQRIQAVFPDGSGQLPPRLTVRETFRETLSVWHRR